MPKQWRLWFLAALPSILAGLLFLLYAAPKQVSGLSAVMPLLHFAPIYLWSVLHARHMPLLWVAMLGLLADMATSLPLGLSALLYCTTVIFIRTQRKYILKEGFSGLWGYFALATLMLQFQYWLSYSFMIGQYAPPGDVIMQWLLTCLLYPPIHYLFYPLVEKIAQIRYRLLHA